MLHYETIDSATLTLLKQLQSIQMFEQLRLVDGIKGLLCESQKKLYLKKM